MKKFFTLIAVAALAFAAQANELSVGLGYSMSNTTPICGLYADTEGSLSQSIYPAEALSEMAGNQITAIKFLTVAYYYDMYGYVSDDETDYINFEDAKFQLALLEVDENGFTDVVAVTGATPVATAVPEYGDMVAEFILDEPFTYTGKNLLVEVTCIEAGDWNDTYFYGAGMDNYCSYYYIPGGGEDGENISKHLPAAIFTYEAGTTPVEPTEMTAAPTFNGYTTDGIHAYFVEIIPTEPSTIYFRVLYPDGTQTDWAEYEDILSFTGNGMYRVEAYAVAPGKLESYPIAYEFVVSPITGLTEMAGDKAVASQRFFNAAGQEMQEANGLTIVVTTYTDGTTSTAKVMK